MHFSTAVFYCVLAVSGLSGLTPAQAAPTALVERDSTHSGDGTYYSTGLGACGWTNNDNDMIAAVSHQFFDSYAGGSANPNKNKICGKMATVHYGSKSTQVKIVDRCGGCSGSTDLDFSPAAFKKLAPLGDGRIKITWNLN